MVSFRIPHNVAYVLDDYGIHASGSQRLFMRRLPGGPTLVVFGSAALIWAIAAEGSKDIASEVALAVGESVETVQPHVDRLMNDFLDRGLLEEV